MEVLRFMIIAICLTIVNCSIFMLGRPKNGFVPKPRTTRKWESKDLPPDQWFDQKLDHFDVTNVRTWKQRYFVNDTFYKKGGPVFLQIGGEGKADPIWMVEGQCIKFASKFQALVVLLEHRYYGNSHPTEDMSIENLRYLSSQQALADLAKFRVYIMKKYKLPATSKWISFGGSYPGSLAAWFRLKYPHLVHASISSSAPMVAVVNFKDYLRVVKESLDTTGPKCNAEIKKATAQVDQMMAHRVGWQVLKKTFKLCDDLDAMNQKDVSNFYGSLAGNFEGVVQYNKDNRAFEGAVGTNITIETLCSIMTDDSIGDSLARYAAVNDMQLQTYGQKCLDYKYSNYISSLQNVSWSSSASEGGRQWTYQTCTEFGYYQSSDFTNQPFGNQFPVKFFVNQCKDIFGDKFNSDLLNEAVKKTNVFYGGKNVSVSRVMFVNGNIDPWHALGITKSLSSEAPAILINGTAHCANMYPDSKLDPPQLITARKMVMNQIAKWLVD